MKSKKLLTVKFSNGTITYDPGAEILAIYLQKGEAFTKEIVPDVFLDVSPDGKTIMGLEIHGVEKLNDT